MLTHHGFDIAERISNILPLKQKIPFYIPEFNHEIDQEVEKSVIAIVSKFKWKHLVVISDNTDVIMSFNKKAAEENICITRNAYIRSKR